MVQKDEQQWIYGINQVLCEHKNLPLPSDAAQGQFGPSLHAVNTGIEGIKVWF